MFGLMLFTFCHPIEIRSVTAQRLFHRHILYIQKTRGANAFAPSRVTGFSELPPPKCSKSILHKALLISNKEIFCVELPLASELKEGISVACMMSV